MPMTNLGQIAIGVVQGQYEHREAPDSDRRHVRAVEWRRTDIPRTAIKQDLLYTLERYARDRITSAVIERYAGHKLEHLVAAVLDAEGFVCKVTKASGDGGVDVFAGRGPFGPDAPRLVVQVKSDASPLGVGYRHPLATATDERYQ